MLAFVRRLARAMRAPQDSLESLFGRLRQSLGGKREVSMKDAATSFDRLQKKADSKARRQKENKARKKKRNQDEDLNGAAAAQSAPAAAPAPAAPAPAAPAPAAAAAPAAAPAWCVHLLCYLRTTELSVASCPARRLQLCGALAPSLHHPLPQRPVSFAHPLSGWTATAFSSQTTWPRCTGLR